MIGSGRAADVYELADDRVLRRYRVPSDVGAEAAIMVHLRAAGYPVPEIFDADGPDLVMTRIREEARRTPLRQAVTRALERTGPTVSSAGLILAGTFGVFALAVGRQPGGGEATGILASIAIGILMDAFLVRTLLVPATVALLGRWNWWPSRHGAPSQAAPEPQPAPARCR